jgi:hypothetical protein
MHLRSKRLFVLSLFGMLDTRMSGKLFVALRNKGSCHLIY